jgi:hypothetical protein
MKELIVFKPVNKAPACYGKRLFITVFDITDTVRANVVTVCVNQHRALTCTTYGKLHVSAPGCLFKENRYAPHNEINNSTCPLTPCSPKILYACFLPSQTCYMTRASHHLCDHSCNGAEYGSFSSSPCGICSFMLHAVHPYFRAHSVLVLPTVTRPT